MRCVSLVHLVHAVRRQGRGRGRGSQGKPVESPLFVAQRSAVRFAPLSATVASSSLRTSSGQRVFAASSAREEGQRQAPYAARGRGETEDKVSEPRRAGTHASKPDQTTSGGDGDGVRPSSYALPREFVPPLRPSGRSRGGALIGLCGAMRTR